MDERIAKVLEGKRQAAEKAQWERERREHQASLVKNKLPMLFRELTDKLQALTLDYNEQVKSDSNRQLDITFDPASAGILTLAKTHYPAGLLRCQIENDPPRVVASYRVAPVQGSFSDDQREVAFRVENDTLRWVDGATDDVAWELFGRLLAAI